MTTSRSRPPVRQLFDAALADHQAGRLAAAKAKYIELLGVEPDHADSAHLLGQIVFTEGDGEGGVALVRRAIASRRRHAPYHTTLAGMLNRLGQPAAAEAAARHAISLDRADAGAPLNLAIALLAQDRPAESERALQRTLQLAPNNTAAQSNLGTVQLRMGRPDLAAATLERAVATAPRDAVAWANLAEAAHDLGDNERARAAAARAVALDPQHAPAHATMGVLQLEAGVVSDSITSCERALALRPSESKYLGNLANALVAAGRPEAALAAYDVFLGRMPDDARARYNKGLCQLLMGNLEAGLDAYEARWGVPSAGFHPRVDDVPRWDADSPTDIRLLVWAEQGIGDHLFNAGFLPALRALGVRCIYECDPRLTGLLQRSFPDVAVIAQGAPPPAYDFQIPAGSLLRTLRRRLASVPVSAGWLRADPTRIAEFGAQLAALGPQTAVGISWRSARRITGVHKSLPLAQWTPILSVPGLRFVNLQYGETDDEIAAACGTGADIYSDPDLDRFNDIDGLAALIASLDLVVTTSNVTAHLAGALGRPSWVALQKVPLWYWEFAGEASRYYPASRLFRQSDVGDWVGVVQRIAAELRHRYLEKNA